MNFGFQNLTIITKFEKKLSRYFIKYLIVCVFYADTGHILSYTSEEDKVNCASEI